jgi:hypothetical protein
MPLPDPWPLGAEEYAWIARKLPDLTNVDRHHEAFLDHHRINETYHDNWPKLWRGWMINAYKREQSRVVSRNVTAPSDPVVGDQDHGFTWRRDQILIRAESLLATVPGSTDAIDHLRRELIHATPASDIDAIAYALDRVERQAFASAHRRHTPS